MVNVLYVGPNASEWAQVNCPVSLASAKWSRGFQSSLSRICNLTTLTHTYMYPWPKGPNIWVGYDKRYYPAGWPCVDIRYPAVRGLREWWWKHAYPDKATRIVCEKNIDVVLIYNCNESWHVPTLRAIRAAKPTVRIYPIVLDGDDPRKDDWGWLKKAAVYANGFICLSWWVHQNITMHTGKLSYHMDGGADGWCGTVVKPRGEGEQRIMTLVHTGALDQWRGLDFMIEVVRELTAKRKDVKFVFTGKSSAAKLQEVFGTHTQVDLPGFVSEERMNEICNGADVLLSVRDPSHPDNILNYPSKLPHYLSFGRPIVSTRLDSLSPDYADVVHFAADDTPASYVARIEEILAWDDARRQQEYETIHKWFDIRKTWDILAKGVVAWIEK